MSKTKTETPEERPEAPDPETGAETPAASASNSAPPKPPQDMIEQQLDVRDQIRYVREFLANPMFFEMGGAKISTSSTQEEIDQHRANLTYKVNVLKAILSLHQEELSGLDRLAPVDATSPEDASEEGHSG